MFAFALFCGCASIIDGSSQNINISTATGETASATITSKVGTQQVTLPTSCYVKRSTQDIIINVKESEDNRSSTMVIPSRFNFFFLGNFLCGGLFGSSTDALTGAMWKYDEIAIVPVYKKTDDDKEKDIAKAEKKAAKKVVVKVEKEETAKAEVKEPATEEKKDVAEKTADVVVEVVKEAE